MTDRWSAWQTELERISPFSAEWNEGQPEDFIRTLEEIVARKRAQRVAVERLGEEIKALRSTYAQALAFFDLERACETWSASNCAGAEVERVLQALAQWRAVLMRYNDAFPPSQDRIQTYAALQECAMEAAAAMANIRPGFGTLSAALSSRNGVVEMPAPEPELAVAAASAQ